MIVSVASNVEVCGHICLLDEDRPEELYEKEEGDKEHRNNIY